MPDRSLRAAAFFDEEARAYDAVYDAQGPEGHPLRVRMAAALRLLGPGPGEVLDVGMGPGRLAEQLERGGWRVSGVDASEGMLALARERLTGARLLRGEIDRLPFPDASFDAVVATGVLEYAPDRARAVGELARVLRPGGRAVVSIPNARSAPVRVRRGVVRPLGRLARRLLRSSRPEPPRRARPPSHAQLARMLAEAGLDVQQVEHTNYLPALGPFARLAPTAALRLAERLERSRPLPGALAAQIVLAARRVAESP
jgi:SAM-dependent methyltransferase